MENILEIEFFLNGEIRGEKRHKFTEQGLYEKERRI
jgi:hypothetical protein